MTDKCNNTTFTITQSDDMKYLSNDSVRKNFRTLASQIEVEFKNKIQEGNNIKDKRLLEQLSNTTAHLVEKIKLEAETTSSIALIPYLNLIFYLMKNNDTDTSKLKKTIDKLDAIINNDDKINLDETEVIAGIFSPTSLEIPSPAAEAAEAEAAEAPEAEPTEEAAAEAEATEEAEAEAPEAPEAPPRPLLRQNAQLLNSPEPPVEERSIVPKEMPENVDGVKETTTEGDAPPPPTEGETSIVPKEMPDPQNVVGEKETTTQAEDVTKLAIPGCPSADVNIKDLKCDDRSRRRAGLTLHPDKNLECFGEANNKFVEYNKMCDKRPKSEDNSAPAEEPPAEPSAETAGKDSGSTAIVSTDPKEVKATGDELSSVMVNRDVELPAAAELPLTEEQQRKLDAAEEQVREHFGTEAPALADALKEEATTAADAVVEGVKDEAMTAATEAAEKAKKDAVSKLQAGLIGNSSRNKTEKLKTETAAAKTLKKNLRKKVAVSKLQAGLIGKSSRNKTGKLKTETAAAKTLKKNLRKKVEQRKEAEKKAGKKTAIEKETASVKVSDLKKNFETKKSWTAVGGRIHKNKTKKGGKRGSKNKTIRRKN